MLSASSSSSSKSGSRGNRSVVVDVQSVDFVSVDDPDEAGEGDKKGEELLELADDDTADADLYRGHRQGKTEDDRDDLLASSLKWSFPAVLQAVWSLLRRRLRGRFRLLNLSLYGGGRSDLLTFVEDNWSR